VSEQEQSEDVQQKENRQLLALIREDPAWALSRVHAAKDAEARIRELEEAGDRLDKCVGRCVPADHVGYDADEAKAARTHWRKVREGEGNG